MNLTYRNTRLAAYNLFRGTVICTAMFAATSSSAFAAPDPGHTYPKLATVQISGQENYKNVSHQRDIAKMDLAVMGFWPNWNDGGLKIRDVVSNIRALNPNITIANYTNINEARTGDSSGAYSELRQKLSTETGPNGRGDWWARDAAGSLTQSWPNSHTMNMTDFVTSDSNGMKLPQWYAQYVAREFFNPVPEFDAIYIDVFRNKPLVNADWNGDGRNDSNDNAVTKQWYTAGQRAYVNALRRLLPEHAVIVNATSWWTESIPENYKNLVDGGILEHALGESWSIEGSDASGTVNVWGSWQKMMTAYHNLVRDSKPPHYVILEMRGRVTDYAFMRYGLTSTLMDNGYFAFDDDSAIFQRVPIFDEYGVDLGHPLEGAQLSPWSNGVYRREFTNGIVLVNPRGNGRQTVALEPGFRRIDGSQDPVHNNGQAVTTITLNDRDGIILLREGGPKGLVRPQPPILE